MSGVAGATVLASTITKWIKDGSGPWLYVLAFVLTFAETGSLLFFIPGEFTLIIAGIAAGAGGINVVVLLLIGCAAAVLGDALGFWIGRRFGKRLQTSSLGRRFGAENWVKAEVLIRRRRGLIVLVGRWIGFLRAIMPATAGMTGMRYRKDFLRYDVAGAVSWASVCVLLGYWLGDRAEQVVQKIGWFGLGGAAVAIGYVLVKRHAGAKKPV